MRTAGLGSGALTMWLYAAFAVPFGAPPMPPEIAAIIAGLFMEAAGAIRNWRNSRNA